MPILPGPATAPTMRTRARAITLGLRPTLPCGR
jgi:hypothetical protein